MTSSLNYISCETKDEHCLVYVTKPGPAHFLLETAFGKSCYRHVSLICGWDSGEFNGRVLNALIGPAERCKKMYIITDLSWRGLLTASRAIKLCRPGRAACLGINDDWLPIAAQAFGAEGYRIDARAEDLRAKLSAAQQSALLRHLNVGPASRAILTDRQEVHLEAFCHEPTVKGLKRLLRAKI